MLLKVRFGIGEALWSSVSICFACSTVCWCDVWSWLFPKSLLIAKATEGDSLTMVNITCQKIKQKGDRESKEQIL